MVQNPQFLIVLPQGLRAPRISYNKKCFQYTEYLFFLLQEVNTISTF